MFMFPPSVHVPVTGLKMLVLPLLNPPFTRTRPSARFAVPGQNMSCPVSVMSRSVDVPVAGSNVAEYVLPPSVLNEKRSSDDQRRILPSGKLAADTGTIGSVVRSEEHT